MSVRLKEGNRRYAEASEDGWGERVVYEHVQQGGRLLDWYTVAPRANSLALIKYTQAERVCERERTWSY